MSDLTQTIQNGLAVGGVRRSVKRNADGVYTGRRLPYFSDPQNILATLYGDFASESYDADMQGYDPDDFYTSYPVKIRCEDVSREATGTNLSDDVKGMVVYYPEGVNYVPLGAHVTFAGNTWLVTNSANISSILSESIIRRCNVVYKRLDYYGNVLTCPFNNPKMAPRGAQDDYTKTMILADHYFTCSMQLNEVSAAIHENTRMILGDAAYSVRGLNNFSQEFTGDDDSVHIIYFQIQREEKVSVYDDMTNHIADGLAFSWDISMTANMSMNAGQAQTITPVSTRNGETVTDTDDYPISYLWTSSDEDVLTVDSDGTVTAIAEGTATVTCALSQNTDITETVEITVTAAAAAYVAFSGALPSSIEEQESVSITAAYYEDGAAMDDTITFTFVGPSTECYTASISGNTVTITCWERSDTTLTVIASYGDYSASCEIALEAW